MKMKNYVIAVMGTILLMERFFLAAGTEERVMNYITYTFCVYVVLTMVDKLIVGRKNHQQERKQVRRLQIFDMKKAE